MDYMDYVDDDAMFMFTNGQAMRMNAALNGPRKLLFQARAEVPRQPRAEQDQEAGRQEDPGRAARPLQAPDLKADGVYGPKTEAIVRGFQEKRKGDPWKLPVNGKVGKKTWIAILA